MAWTIVLEDENKEQLLLASKELDSELLKIESEKKSFKMLKYLNPYGDSIFNSIQIPDLLVDLQNLKEHGEDKDMINEIIGLANKYWREPHTYLAFYGD